MRRYLLILLMMPLLFLIGCSQSETAAATPSQQLQNPPAAEEKAPAATSTSAPEKAAAAVAPEQKALADFQKTFAEKGQLYAVAYLGYMEGDYPDITTYLDENGFLTEYPFLQLITQERLAQMEGGELYAVVPAGKEVSLTVSEYRLDEKKDYMPVVGRELFYAADGLPVLLQGNVSEIVPNLHIRVEKAGLQAIEYNPSLSMMDGRLSIYSDSLGVYDFTPYDLLEVIHTDESIFCGTWYNQSADGNGELQALTLTLEAGGHAVYSYGVPRQNILERFEGSWSFSGRNFTLDLQGGPVDMERNPVQSASYPMSCVFHWDIQGEHLVLEHTGGAALLPGTDGKWLDFLPFNAYLAAGDWETYTNDVDGNLLWYDELNLLENGEVRFRVLDSAGTLWAEYAGWWSLEGNEMVLSMGMMAGSQYVPELYQTLNGRYQFEISESGLALTYVMGDYLTSYMEETGIEYLWLKAGSVFSPEPQSAREFYLEAAEQAPAEAVAFCWLYPPAHVQDEWTSEEEQYVVSKQNGTLAEVMITSLREGLNVEVWSGKPVYNEQGALTDWVQEECALSLQLSYGENMLLMGEVVMEGDASTCLYLTAPGGQTIRTPLDFSWIGDPIGGKWIYICE